MFERLKDVVHQLSKRVTLEKLRLIEAMFDEVPGVSVVREDDRVVAEGRGLVRRMIEDPRLRGGHR